MHEIPKLLYQLRLVFHLWLFKVRAGRLAIFSTFYIKLRINQIVDRYGQWRQPYFSYYKQIS